MQSTLPPVMADHEKRSTARRWMSKNGRRFHAALSGNGRPEASVTATENQECHEITTFCQMMQRYSEITNEQNPTEPTFNIYAAHSWTEVAQIAQRAQEKYLADGSGLKNAHRALFRRLGEYSDCINPWLGLLPNDMYFSIACGGLKVILGMAEKRSEQRRQIIETFSQIPEIVFYTQRYHQLFKESDTLKRRLYDVFVALLNMMQAMISCLVNQNLWDKIKEGLISPVGNKSLHESRQHFTTVQKLLEDEIQFLLAQTNVASNDTIGRVERSTITISSNVEDIQTDMTKQAKVTTEIQSTLLQLLSSQEEAKMNIVEVLTGLIGQAEWQQQKELRALQSKVDRLQRKTPKSALLNLISIDTCDLQQLYQDLEDTRSASVDIDLPSQNQARQLLSNPRFHAWISKNQSDVLLIDGNADDYGIARCSPLSLVSSILVSQLVEQQNTQVLAFFCGMHSTRRSRLAGPVGLVKGLIAELLMIGDYDLEFIHWGQRKTELQKNNLSVLCEVLKQLVVQNHGTVLFCVIDGASHFESSQWRAQLETILQKLVEMAEDESVGIVFKLLITSPGINRAAKRVIAPENRVFLTQEGGYGLAEDFVTEREIAEELYRPLQIAGAERSEMMAAFSGAYDGVEEYR